MTHNEISLIVSIEKKALYGMEIDRITRKILSVGKEYTKKGEKMYTVEFHIMGMKGKWEHKFRTKKATAEFIEAIKKVAEAQNNPYLIDVKKNGEYIIFK